jgi:hypothetical protein
MSSLIHFEKIILQFTFSLFFGMVVPAVQKYLPGAPGFVPGVKREYGENP